jgi:hypothetical protein
MEPTGVQTSPGVVSSTYVHAPVLVVSFGSA